jgi:DNA mismatch repair protein MutS
MVSEPARQDTADRRRALQGTQFGSSAGHAALPDNDMPLPAADGRTIPLGAPRFHSILFDNPADRIEAERRDTPGFFADLNLDQIVDAVTASKSEYNLKPFFYASLTNIEAIAYRHEVMRDLEVGTVLAPITDFAQRMRSMREHLVQADKLRYQYQKESWFLDAVEIYCDAVNRLADDLALAEVGSRGFLAFRAYLANYAASNRFSSLLSETRKLKDDLSAIEYVILVKDGSFTVRKYDSEANYSIDVEQTFEKFKQGAVKNYAVKFSDPPEMNHIEAKALEFVARLYPDIFHELAEYRRRNAAFLDDAIAGFDREIQFYVAYLDYVATLKAAGLKFCYPQVSNLDKEVRVLEGFDLALAHKLVGESAPVVCNDFYLNGKERIFVVSGPNQGGKTTFARMFGQLHYLASIACPVPGREARLLLFDRLFTHFEKEEEIGNLRGKLEDDLTRLHHVFDEATSNSIIVMNEIFTSTALSDAVFLGKNVIQRITELDSLCVCVTFIDELASLSGKTVSVVSMVVPENPAQRTFKVVRRAADGLSYAISIAEKYRLTYECLKGRVGS